jgi:hypothetical protein
MLFKILNFQTTYNNDDPKIVFFCYAYFYKRLLDIYFNFHFNNLDNTFIFLCNLRFVNLNKSCRLNLIKGGSRLYENFR